MRLELTRVGLLVKLANHYTTRGALVVKRSGYKAKLVHKTVDETLDVHN